MKKILVVDDNAEILEVIAIILEGEGYKVNCYPTGELLLETVNTFKPDLILLDIMLGDYDGRELCDALKNNSETSHIPVVLISAANDLQLHANKADGFVAKPFELDYLTETVAALIN